VGNWLPADRSEHPQPCSVPPVSSPCGRAYRSPWLWRPRVPHQLLHHLHVVAILRQQRAVGVPEGMPADPLGDLCPLRSGLQDPLQGGNRPDRHLPEDCGTSKDPVGAGGVHCDLAPRLQLRRVRAPRGTGCCETSVLQSPTSPSTTERSTLACPFWKSMSSHLRPSVPLMRSPAVAQIMPIARSRSGSLPNSARNSSSVNVSGVLRCLELQRSIAIGFSCCPIHPQRIAGQAAQARTSRPCQRHKPAATGQLHQGSRLTATRAKATELEGV
jgi:hypothetical protein